MSETHEVKAAVVHIKKSAVENTVMCEVTEATFSRRAAASRAPYIPIRAHDVDDTLQCVFYAPYTHTERDERAVHQSILFVVCACGISKVQVNYICSALMIGMECADVRMCVSVYMCMGTTTSCVLYLCRT